MAPSKRRRDDDDDSDQESEIVDVQSARSDLRQTNGKRSRLSLARENGGSVVSDEDEDEGGDYNYNYTYAGANDHVQDVESDEEELAEVDEVKVSEYVLKQLKKDEMKDNMPQEQGIIEEVFCRNFMCHTKLRIKLGPLINFIIGHNGSGKSAVLTALTLCLGGTASSTNRGKSLKSFVKEGEDSATLSVKIKNQGEMAYQPDVYGDSIIVERHFTRAGVSSFKLKNVDDRLVSSKRSDLEDILDYLALQLDNPMNVLTQDSARQFLNSSSPADKYKFFIRGTQLEQLDRDYRLIEESVNSMEASLYARGEDVQDLAKIAQAAEEKRKLIEASNSIRQKIKEYQWMHAWAQVEEMEAEVAGVGEDLAAAERMVEAKENAAKGASDAFDHRHQIFENAIGGKEELEADLLPQRERHEKIKEKFDGNRNELMENGVVRRQIQIDVRSAKADVAKFKAAIAEEQIRIDGANGPAQAQRLAALEEAKAEVESLKRNEDGDKTPLERDRDAIQKNLAGLKDDREKQQGMVERAEVQLQSLQKDQGGGLQNYHPNISNLLRAIKNETRFRQTPVGPLGMHVRLLKPEWSSVIERTFGRNLEGFVVSCKSDQRILSELVKKTNCETTILIGDSQPIDTSPHEPDAGQATILRVLDISNDLARNSLIINQGIDQTVLIKDRNAAMQYMTGSPRNVKATICMHDTIRGQGIRIALSRSGDVQSGPVQAWDRKLRMKSDIDTQIRLQQENVTQAKRELGEIDNEIRKVQGELERAKQALVRFDRQKRDARIALQRAESRVEQIEEEIEGDQVDASRLDTLKEQLKEAEEAEAQHSGSYVDATVAKDSLNAIAHELKADLDSATTLVTEGETKIKKWEAKMVKLEQARTAALHEKNKVIGLVEVAKQERDEIAERHQRKARELATLFIPEATKICERIAVTPGLTIDIIDDKLDKLNQERKRFEQRAGGSREEITLAWHTALTNFKNAKRTLRSQAQMSTTMKRALVGRKSRWRMFRREITARAKIMFMYLLSERAFRGRIIVDHNDKALDISVEPDMTKSSDAGRQSKTLSGGEKSFSTICLLLSIWEAMGSPIRCLDEFDVFMDNVNRDISMKMMIQAARRSVGRQFILITPQAMGNVHIAGDVKIHKMTDPERGQTSLPFTG